MDERDRLRVVDEVADLGLGQAIADGDGDGAEPGDRVPGDEDFGPVAQHDGNAVAGSSNTAIGVIGYSGHATGRGGTAGVVGDSGAHPGVSGASSGSSRTIG